MPVPQKGQQILGRFTLINPLGQGGMGEVWLAYDKLLEDRIALKFIKPALSTSPDLVNLLRQECRNARRLSHPNIVRVFDFHSAPPWHFLSMEYVEGRDISQFTGQSYRIILSKLLPIIDALGYAHSLGLVHLDIKVTNILIDNIGQARLTDFGIAAIIRSDTSYSSGGTPYAMSPQLFRQQPPTPADDIYALGVLLYELLSGFPPFHPQITRDRILVEEPAPINCSQPLPAELLALVMAMLAKSAQARPSSMNEIAAVLRSLIPVQETTLPPISKTIPTNSDPVTVSPLSLETVSSSAQHTRQGMAGNGTRIIAIAAFAILLSIAGGIFYYLPQRVQDMQFQSISAQRSKDVVTANGPVDQPIQAEHQEPWEQARITRSKQEADNIVLSLLEKQTLLQNMNVAAWSNGVFETALTEARKGDELYAEGRLQKAISAYTSAAALMDELITDSSTVLDDALKQGWRALAASDSARGIESFQIVLAIDPTHEEGARGLLRARRLPEALALLESGAQQEQHGNLTLSRLEYSKAAELDPDLEAAHKALLRIDRKIKESQFRIYMTDGLSALSRDDFKAAREAFEKARVLNPTSQAVAEGLSRLTLRLHHKQIEAHGQAAASLETQERWREAEAQYQAVLTLDPTLVFAKRGKARSARRASLSEALDFHIQNPQRLTTDSVLAEAVHVRDQAAAIETPGPGIRTQIEKLSDLIESATTPVRVRLTSDNKTRVIVYKVGNLGTFESKDLSLRPGSYTLVGTRDGYRDVRRQLTVVAGQSPDPVLVRCEEQI